MVLRWVLGILVSLIYVLGVMLIATYAHSIQSVGIGAVGIGVWSFGAMMASDKISRRLERRKL